MRPHVIIHLAVSLDGRTSGFPVDLAAYYEPVSGWKENATLVGSDTILASPDPIAPETDEDLIPPTSPSPDDNRPILVVPDSRGRIRTWHYWRKQPYWKDILVFCAPSTPRGYLKYLDDRHIQHITTGRHRVNLEAALEILDKQFHVQTVRVDSGGTLASILLQQKLADRLSLLVHPVLVGPGKNTNFFRPLSRLEPGELIQLALTQQKEVNGNLLWLDYRITHATAPTENR